ncbi:MAG TPA: tetratricopeptide repeat protein [Gemmatimonadaceae bacterium]|nr:tetratricopeptide repeat protein [Gemmatimonadaceae bacterium]
MLAPLSPLDAYRTDLDRHQRRSEFGNADTVWLLLAHCLGRLSKVGESVRDQLALQSANALRDLAESAEGADGGDPAHLHDLRMMIAGLSAIETRVGADAVSRACRGFAARMAESGALSVAYSVIGFARTVAADASDRERGLLAADQARIARQLGELDSAEELYRTASAIGERSSDHELQSRASLGRGVIARVRGNYPRARAFFQHGLSLASAAGSRELEFFAHQGLTIVTCVTGDSDASIRHGWEAFRLAEGDITREAETLTNLAQLCLEYGYPRAAVSGFFSALSRTRTLRIRLAALGGTALAAGRLEDHALLTRVRAELVETMEGSSLPYENAQALFHLSAAYLAVGDDVTAERFRQEVARIAGARGYHELAHQVERAELARAARLAAQRELGSTSRAVVTTLEAFEPDAEALALAARCAD